MRTRSLMMVIAAIQSLPVVAQTDSLPATRRVPVTPAEKVAAISVEYDDALKAYREAYKTAKAEDDKLKAGGDSKAVRSTPLANLSEPKAESFFPALFEIAKAHPKDEAAEKALVWIMRHDGRGEARKEAIALLAKDHIDSPDLKQVLGSLSYSLDRSDEDFLRTVMKSSPHEEVRAYGAYNLAQLLRHLAASARSLGDHDPGKRARLAAVDVERTDQEVEALLESVKSMAAGTTFGASLAEAAEGDLFEIRNLAIGKVAPEITGEDVEGRPLRLSDFRGKVVVLDFWGFW